MSSLRLESRKYKAKGIAMITLKIECSGDCKNCEYAEDIRNGEQR